MRSRYLSLNFSSVRITSVIGVAAPGAMALAVML
jgi:hypothetical protein